MRLAYAVLGLAVLAALLIASEGLLLWVLYYGTEAWRLVPAMGAPLLLLVATVIAVRSYALRSVAAGAIIAVGLLTVWATVWRLAWPEVGVTWLLSLAGGLAAIGAGIVLLYVRTTPAPHASAASDEP